MLQALLSDLLELPDVEILTTRDARLPPLPCRNEVVTVSPALDIWNIWQSCIDRVDAVWPIAPESGDILECISRMVIQSGKKLLGCHADAIAVATRKSLTSRTLSSHGLRAVPTFFLNEPWQHSGHAWVVKPDDGAGCENTFRFENADDVRRCLEQQGWVETHVIQPFLPGQPVSLSMLCREGKSWLLSCNRQNISLDQQAFSYHGSILNAMTQHWVTFEQIACGVVQALPGLAGYVGVDMILDDTGITVLEINPRLTTSYVGMHQALGYNPARLILDLFYNEAFELPVNLARNVVEISLDE